MLKVNIQSTDDISDNYVRFFSFLHFFLFVTLIAALLGEIGYGLLFGRLFGTIGLYIIAGLIGTAAMIIILILKQDELAITVIVAARVYVDYYLGLGFVALAIMAVLLVFYFISRNTQNFRLIRNLLWVWILLLLISIIPAMRGISLQDGAYYYCNVILSAFLMFCLGVVIGSNIARIKLLFRLISLFAVFIAISTIIQATTGKLLLGTTGYDAYLASIGNYALSSNTSILRTGSFFVNPNPCGEFLAMTLLLPLGLFWGSSTWLGKMLYLSEIFISLSALVFCFSTGAWLSLCVGVGVFLMLVGRANYRLILLFIIAGSALFIVVVFPSQIAFQLQHAGDPWELQLRSGAWQTGVQVIRAFPLFGLGLGRHVYLLRAEPYRVITPYRPLNHPHNAFLELAALGGLPVALVFITLLLLTSWLVLRNWFRSDISMRPLIASGMAVATALTTYSLSDAGWTLSPLQAVGWLVLGTLAIPTGSNQPINGIWKAQEKGSIH